MARAPFTILLDVQHDSRGAPFASAEGKIDQELKGAQGLATVADQQAGVVALDIDDGHLFTATGAAYGGRGVHIHPVEEAPDDAERGSGGAIPVRDAPDADPGILGADAEYPTAPRANDVDFDFVATDAELQGCEFDCFLYCLR